MSSSPDLADLLLDTLRRHPRRVLPTTELTARLHDHSAGAVTAALEQLSGLGSVRIATMASPDPHVPDLTAVAVVDPTDPDAAAGAQRRARLCVQHLQTQLLLGHRCT